MTVSNPLSPEDAIRQAVAAEQAGDPLRAGLLYDAVASRVPGHEAAAAGLARLASRARDATRRLPKAAVEALHTLLRTGHAAEAEAHARALAQKLPDAVPPYLVLGEAFLAQGKAEAALTVLGHAARVSPGHVDILVALAKAQRAEGQDEAAIATLTAARRHAPRNPLVLSMLGETYRQSGLTDEAHEALDAVVRAFPDHPAGYGNRGQLLFDMGRMADAERDFETMLRLQPTAGVAHRMLTVIRRHGPDDPHTDAMRALLDRPDLGAEDRVHIEFAMAKVMEDTGAHDRVFAHLNAGNGLHRRAIRYNQQAQLATIDMIRKLASAPFVERMAALGSTDERPVFIVGMPRSGTSLAEQILSSHSRVAGAGELQLLSQRFGPWLKRGRFSPEDLTALGAEYAGLLDRLAPGAARVVDKMPFNYVWLGFIAGAFPRARIIHMRRDPMDTCLSIYKLMFGDTGMGFAYDQQELGRYYLAYAETMDHWRRELPDRFIECRYEDLVADQEGESRRLIEYCGLDWEDGVLDFHRTDRAVRTASGTQVRRKIYNSSVAAWRRYEKDLAPLRQVLAPLLDQ